MKERRWGGRGKKCGRKFMGLGEGEGKGIGREREEVVKEKVLGMGRENTILRRAMDRRRGGGGKK